MSAPIKRTTNDDDCDPTATYSDQHERKGSRDQVDEAPSAAGHVEDDLGRHVGNLTEGPFGQPLCEATDRIRNDQNDHSGKNLPTRYLS